MARKRRVFKQRTNKKMLFTFHSYGTHIEFAPFDFITDDRLVDESGNFVSISKLDFYRDEVLMANVPHVYILDNTGQELQVV